MWVELTSLRNLFIKSLKKKSKFHELSIKRYCTTIHSNVEHLLSGKLAMDCIERNNPNSKNVSPKYKLDSEQHGVILRCLQNIDPAKEQTVISSENVVSCPGDDNFDHKLLVNMKLVVPCSTWQLDDARKYFGLHYHDKTTVAFVRKVKSPNTKRVAFDLEFPEIPPSIYKTWTFPLDSVLKYACGLN